MADIWTNYAYALFIIASLIVWYSTNKKAARTPELRAPLPEREDVVCIIGASFAGAAVAKQLPRGAVTVIDRHSFAEYTPGILRSYVDDSHYESVSVNLAESLTKKAHVIHGEVLNVVFNDASSGSNLASRPTGAILTVQTENGRETVRCSSLVIAAGSSYPLAKPAAVVDSGPDLGGAGARRRQLQGVAAHIASSRSILLVGGGPVGVELAGEIISVYRTSKVITLLTSGQVLLDGMHPDMGKAAHAWLVQRGVTVVYGDRVPGLMSPPLPGMVPVLAGFESGRTVVSKTGLSVPAEYICLCMGMKSNTVWTKTGEEGQAQERENAGPISSPPPSLFPVDAGGRIIVNAAGEVAGLEGKGIFALGDCAAHPAGEPALAHTAEKQAEVIAFNVLSVLSHARGEIGAHLEEYPHALFGSNKLASPVIFCVSMGPWHALLDFNGRIVLSDPWFGQPLAGFLKRVIEATKVSAMRGQWWGTAFWVLADVMAGWTGRFLPRLSVVQDKRAVTGSVSLAARRGSTAPHSGTVTAAMALNLKSE